MNKQLEILKFVHKNGRTTKQEIMDRMPWGYYCNGPKHFGDMISRMVKNGMLIRVKRGTYEYNENRTVSNGPSKIEKDKNQTELF